MSKLFDLFCLTVLLIIPSAQVLSVVMGVGGWMCPRNLSVSLSGQASWPHLKAAPTSASAAEDMTFFMMLHSIWMLPLMGGLSSGLRLLGLHDR